MKISKIILKSFRRGRFRGILGTGDEAALPFFPANEGRQAPKGNTGAASIFIILEERFHSDLIEKGQKLLCFIPESGRFSMCYMLLTAV